MTLSGVLVRGALAIFLAAGMGLLAACGSEVSKENATVASETELDSRGIARLGGRTLIFGHMSVGYDIVNGLLAVQAADGRLAGLNVREVKDAAEIAGPGIYHVRNGPNGRPAEKCSNFAAVLEKANSVARLDAALFKFCYVDIQAETDVEGLFKTYVATVNEVRRRFPGLVVVHVTTPLMAHGFTMKARLKNLLKGDPGNVQRNRFNAMLLKEYGGREPVFDLAAVESTRPDGSRETFTWKGVSYQALWTGYTTDGGHLNDQGKRVAALELLRVLSALP